MRRLFIKQLVIFLVLPCLLMGFALRPVHAGMISTADAVSVAAGETPYSRVASFIERQDVQQIMARQGVDLHEAHKRIQAMSDVELLALADQIEKLPAGGDFGAVIGAAVFVFLVLLITDILGFTHVFPFVNR